MLLSKSFLGVSPVVVVILLLVVAAPLLLMIMSTNSVFVNGNYNNNNAYAQQTQFLPSYFIRIFPGSTFAPEDPQHYSITDAAVPAGTTVAWFNDDTELFHTVTSGVPGNPSGLFDSGNMPFGDRFQLTFTNQNGLIGEFPYYCTLHPWITARISSNDTIVKGESFDFMSGTGPTLDLSKNPRTLLAFTPLAMSVDQADPMHYNFSITRNSDNEKMFEERFEVESNNFQIELIQFSQSEAATAGINIPFWYGPDAGIQYTGAYHAAGDFFSEPGDYTLGVELVSIGTNPPPQQMRDEFTMSVVSNAIATNATAAT